MIGLPIGPNTAKQIIHQVLKKHDITFDQVTGHDRKRLLVIPRREMMWRLYNETRLSLTAIGRILNRDHTSVLHGVRNHAATLEAEKLVHQSHQEAA